MLEVKTVDWLERKKWGDEPPANYLLQPNTYAGLLKVEWFDVIVMVLGGNTDMERFQYNFRPKLYAETERRVADFWRSIEVGKSPKPDYSRDGGALAELYGSPDDTIIDLRTDNRMPSLMQEYLDAKAEERRAACLVDAAKAEILEKLGRIQPRWSTGIRAARRLSPVRRTRSSPQTWWARSSRAGRPTGGFTLRRRPRDRDPRD